MTHSRVSGERALSTDPYDILLGHNRWANRVLLERCATLAPEQFHRRFDIGPGTLHDTLSHIIGAMFRWSDRIAAVELRPSIEGRAPGDHSSPVTRRLPIDLIKLNDDAAADLAGTVAKMKAGNHLAETRSWKVGPDTYRFTVAAAVIHVTNHGMHHRAQCMNMLKRLGQAIDADLDELEWQVAGEP